MIDENSIREVSQRSNCVTVVGRFVELKKAGTLFKGLCPFHEERTPSFTVSPLRNTYHCFGCGAHGDSIRFLMEVGGRQFPEAVRELADEFGVVLNETRSLSPQQVAKAKRAKAQNQRLYELLDKVSSFFTESLFSVSGRLAQKYLERRGISPTGARAFRLGYCPSDVEVFRRFIDEAGIELSDLIHLGVLSEPRDGYQSGKPLDGAYLRFRDRLVCPIVDLKDQVTGFSCRLLQDQRKAAKYVNSPESSVFVKGEQLYGASTAKKSARSTEKIIICEGNLDVVALWEFGFRNSVAAMGTAITDHQALLLRRLAKDVTVVMDGDAAGRKAAFKGLPCFLRAGLQPRAVMMPDDHDPDSYLRSAGADAFAARIGEATPLIELFFDECISRFPNDEPGRLQAMRAIAVVMIELDDELAKRLYIQRLEQKLQLSSDLIEHALKESEAKQRVQEPPEPRRENITRPERSRAAIQSIPRPPQEPYEIPVFTGLDAPNFEPMIDVSEGQIYFPPFLAQIIGFIVQFPAVSVDFFEREGHKFLTQSALVGFLGVLRQNAADGKTPNVDRILSSMTCSQTVSFLRMCQAQEPSTDLDAVRSELPRLIDRLELDFLRNERIRLQNQLRVAFRENDPEIPELQKQLRLMQTRLAQKQVVGPEGGN